MQSQGQNSRDKTHSAGRAEEAATSHALCMMDVKQWQGKLCRNEFGSVKANKEGSVKGKRGIQQKGSNVPYDLKIGSKQQEGNGTSRQLCFGDEHKLSACDLNTAD